MATEILLQTEGLTKRYKGAAVAALDDLTLHVASGEVYGFLGSNGAGKSTTIRALLGFLQPTSGSASICGLNIAHNSVTVKQHVGYLAGDIALYPKVTGQELFDYLLKLQQSSDRDYLNELIQKFKVDPQQLIGSLSKGNRQKIGIIQAFMHKPDVLILDEPTSGLDPLMQEVFYETVHVASKRGAAVFVSSHNLTETQRMCDRIGIIKHGKLIHEQAINTSAVLSKPVFKIVLASAEEATKLNNQKALKILRRQGPVLTTQPTAAIGAALAVLGKLNITYFETVQPSLEDEFLEYYGDGA